MQCWSCSGAVGDGKWRSVPVALDGKNVASAVVFTCDPCAGDKTEVLA